MSISVEDLLDIIAQRVEVNNWEWIDYLRARYGWKKELEAES